MLQRDFQALGLLYKPGALVLGGSCMYNDRLLITTGTRVLYFTTSRLQEATQQHTMVHPMVYCQAAAGLHSTKGCSLHSSVSSFQLQANSNHALPRVPPLFTVVGVKASHGSYELACKREVRFLEGSGYSFHLLFRGRIGGHYCATGSNGGGLHSLVQVAGLSAHRLRAIIL